ncbi:replication-associated recombination protein A [Ureaplasma ceti]|uniref:Replication-associated recombination protein A n=1 Tax=Ureaplasma ceti TaxID=3119530 RepID=A0ABP9U9W6_9BACT
MINKSSLANDLRPESLDDIVGQQHLLADNGVLKRMIETRSLFSIIFYGNPGIGKTSMAVAIAKTLGIPYSIFNATTDNKDKLVRILNTAKLSTEYIVIVEEVHRMNRDKQDILLSGLEDKSIVAFLTTTENPFFVINPAVRSRCQIFQLKPINKEDMFVGIKKLIDNKKIPLIIQDKYIKQIVNLTNGDFRSTLNLFDLLVKLYSDQKINESIIEKIYTQSYVLGSSEGDEIHNLKSALQKSIRGSDPDASLYYLFRLIKIGDFEALFRRLLVIAYEDIGLANPNMGLRVKQAIDIFKEIGMPEGKYPLTAIVIEMALSPKSNSISQAMYQADYEVENGGIYEIPAHLKDTHYKSAAKLGIKGYKFPHDYPGNYVEQDYMPPELAQRKYYYPNYNNVNEAKMNDTHAKFIKSALEKQNK